MQIGAFSGTADDVSKAVPVSEAVLAEAARDAAARQTILGMEMAGEHAWPTPVEPGVRPWARPLAIAGFTGWVCASLAVIAVASIAASKISSLPPVAVQAAEGLPAPPLASAAAPHLAPAPATEQAAPIPVQTAWAAAPVPEPSPSPEPERSGSGSALAAGAVLPEAAEPSTVIEFAGPILNDTMRQGGLLSLQLRTQGAHGPVAAVFHASKGLIGSGVLNGAIGRDGRITLSGRLMMGRNPFDCALEATFRGERLVGAATFVRATSGAAAHSSFTLTRL